ncbi:MAG: hypothetical protein KDC39_15525 [Actinobacteria bacterium]|nr:hypothetical protein [Actinomycetota bacterium]
MLARMKLVLTKAWMAVLGPADRGEDPRTELEIRLEKEWRAEQKAKAAHK